MTFYLFSALAALGMFATSLTLINFGGRIRQRLGEPESGASNSASFSAIETGLFGLFGLLLAFTFSGAVARFDERREAIVKEANAISVAYRTLDLLPSSARDSLRSKMRDYLAARLEEQSHPYDFIGGQTSQTDSRVASRRLQSEIWQELLATRSTASPVESIDQVLIPGVNEAFSVARTRTALASRHPPILIYVALFVLAGVCSIISGYAMGMPAPMVHRLSFAASLALSLFLTLEIEFPRQGIVRLDGYDAVLANALSDFP